VQQLPSEGKKSNFIYFYLFLFIFIYFYLFLFIFIYFYLFIFIYFYLFLFIFIYFYFYLFLFIFIFLLLFFLSFSYFFLCQPPSHVLLLPADRQPLRSRAGFYHLVAGLLNPTALLMRAKFFNLPVPIGQESFNSPALYDGSFNNN